MDSKEIPMNLVLLSGGWESVGCLIKAQKEGATKAIFFDYAQPYVKEEMEAVERLQFILGFELVKVKIDVNQDGKYFEQRNAMFLHVAKAQKINRIFFGCRGLCNLFDAYEDSNWQFAREMSKELGVEIVTPFIMWPKFMVKHFVKSNGITSDMIYSSEGYKYD